ncbi:SufE family protein [Consotaella salsifontis]|uniref:Cysteine desulfuration protein SufE n=1 Tax=Consotaella salsifontis TaxID=1365950 RepID=A0A1T4MFX7_9HYPH|nr:SufE family protein [Consotaella salsifontis]SJZ65832.1 Cysteine desulfuration protein SufE [Consotaella salsifontis]
MPTFEDIAAEFEFLDEWEDRYRYLIELGRQLPEMPPEAQNDTNKVRGCVSQVWLISHKDGAMPPHLTYEGESDAHIVRGLVAIALTLFSGKTAPEILEIDAEAAFARLGLKEHLTPQRSNGLRAMVTRIKEDARHALEAV